MYAEINKFGILVGVNYFDKTDKIEYKIYDNNELAYGRVLYDNDGFSFQLGCSVRKSNKSSLLIKYRTPRKCSYEYPATSTPYVWGPNTYLIKTETSSLIIESRYSINEIQHLHPNFGFGIDIINIKAYNRKAFIRPQTGEYVYYSPVDDYWYAGSKYFIGALVSLGVTKPITDRISIDFEMNYTFLKLDYWGNNNPRTEDQNLSGLYFNLSIVFH